MNVLKKKTKCYIYTRVSTAIQVDGYSLDAQKDKLRKYAEFQDMEIVGEYSDEGHSGKNIKGRQEFMRMLNDIEDGKDGLLVDFFDATQLAHRLADVLSRNKGMYSMRQQARQTIVDHYDLHTICLPGLLKFFAKTRNDC